MSYACHFYINSSQKTVKHFCLMCIRDIEIMKIKTIDQLKKVEQELVFLSSEKLH